MATVVADFCEPDCDGDDIIDACDDDDDGDGIPDNVMLILVVNSSPTATTTVWRTSVRKIATTTGPSTRVTTTMTTTGVSMDAMPIHAASLQADCDQNGIFDDCEPDCDGDGVIDACDTDDDGDGIPDDCDADFCGVFAKDCNQDGVFDDCQLEGNDCNANMCLMIVNLILIKIAT